MKKISVIIPVFNAEDYLNECLASVVSQTNCNLEILLIDDNSTDESLSICKKWEAKYPEEITVFPNPQKGSLLARREGLKQSSGDLIFLMDADDYLLSNVALCTAEQTLEKYNCDLVFFNATQDGINPYYKYCFGNESVFEKEGLSILLDKVVTEGSFFTTWNKLIKRELFDWEEDYSDYSTITKGTDMFQMIPVLSNAKKIVYLDAVYYYYRKTPGSITRTFKQEKIEAIRTNFLRLKHFSESWENKPEDLDRKLACFYLRNCLAMISLISLSEDKRKRRQYYHSIRDDLFISEFHAAKKRTLSKKGKICIFLLYLKLFNIIDFLQMRGKTYN